MPGVQIGTGVDPALILHKRRHPMARLLCPCHVPQRPCPFADGLVVGLAVGGAANDRGEGIRVRVDREASIFERSTYESFCPPSSTISLHDREHRLQITVDGITTTIPLT